MQQVYIVKFMSSITLEWSASGFPILLKKKFGTTMFIEFHANFGVVNFFPQIGKNLGGAIVDDPYVPQVLVGRYVTVGRTVYRV